MNIEVCILKRGEDLKLLEEDQINEYVKEIEIEKKEAEENAAKSKKDPVA